MEAILTARHLQLPPRLQDISIELQAGQTLGLLGINGAGKSSVLAALAGVLPLRAGKVSYQGRSLHAEPQLRRHIGWLPQHAPLYEDMSVRENLDFARGLHGCDHKVLQQSIEQFDLGNLQKRLARRLSGGERMRLGLACCLIHQPDVLLLDEPTAGLDPLQAQQLRELIAALSPQRAVLIASHLLSDIESLCQRALLLDQGQVVADEPVNTEQPLMLAEFSSPPDDASLLRIAGVERVHSRDGSEVVLQLGADAVPHMPEKLACHGWGLRLWKPMDNELLRRFHLLGQGATGNPPK
jgi:ABC-2 type transport system ATP-binding protein